MADSSIDVTPGTGASVDFRTVENGDERQVVVVGGDGTAANIAPVDATNGLAVDLKANGIVGEVQATPTAFTLLGRLKTIEDDLEAAQSASIPAGAALIGDVGLGVRTSGGATPYYNDGVCTETEVKAGEGQIYMISAVNASASVRWLQLFNNTAAGVTPGTTTPTNEWPIPTQGDTNGAGMVITLPVPLAYGTGITFFISTAKGGGSAATADDVMLNLGYK